MIYRLSFDFSTATAMRDFFENFQEMTLQPDQDDFRNCVLVHHDSLHDRQKVLHCLVRGAAGGNGTPVVYKDTTSIFECEILEPGQDHVENPNS